MGLADTRLTPQSNRERDAPGIDRAELSCDQRGGILPGERANPVGGWFEHSPYCSGLICIKVKVLLAPHDPARGQLVIWNCSEKVGLRRFVKI